MAHEITASELDRIVDLCRGYKLNFALRDRVFTVDLTYPRIQDGRPNVVEVGIEDVRAADSIQIAYDFDRDGYVIKQASRFNWEPGDQVCDPDWQEVGFIQAWARAEPETFNN